MPLFFVLSAFIEPHLPIAFCVLKRLIGVPCPACGLTASVMALAHGELRESIHSNAAGCVVILFYLAELLSTIACRSGVIASGLAARMTRSGDRILAFSLLAQWGIRLVLLN